jgi:O-antigen ligase
LVIACQTLANWRRRSDASLVDLLPAAYVAYVFCSIAITTTLLQDDLFGTAKTLVLTTALGAGVYYFLVFGPGRAIASISIARVLLVGALGQAILALAEWGTGWNLWGRSPWQYSDPPRAVATLVSPPALGVFLGCGIVLALAVIAWAGPVELRRLSWLVVVLGLPALLVTYTRAPIVATAVVALGVLLLARSARLVALGAVAVTALALVAVWPQLSASKLYETRIAESTNIAGRADIQDISLKAAKAKPLTGWGYGSFDTTKTAEGASVDVRVQGVLATSSHNGFLTVLVELGGVGLVLLLAPWVVIVARGIGAARQHHPERWLVVACVAAVAVFALTAGANDLRFFSFVYALPLIFLGLLRRDGLRGGEPFTS